jgi:hypothetical protein
MWAGRHIPKLVSHKTIKRFLFQLSGNFLATSTRHASCSFKHVGNLFSFNSSSLHSSIRLSDCPDNFCGARWAVKLATNRHVISANAPQCPLRIARALVRAPYNILTKFLITHVVTTKLKPVKHAYIIAVDPTVFKPQTTEEGF